MKKKLTKGEKEFADYVATNMFDELYDGINERIDDEISEEVWLAIFTKVRKEASIAIKNTKANIARKANR